MCAEYTTVMYTKFYLPGTLNVSVRITVLQRTRLFKRSLALIENDSVSRTNILIIYLHLEATIVTHLFFWYRNLGICNTHKRQRAVKRRKAYIASKS